MKHDELAQYLGALSRQENYRTDEVLKSSSFETTERVYFNDGSNAEQGPFIRKTIVREAGLGSAYERIFAEQQQGTTLKHLPIIVECFPRETDLVVVMEYVQGETLQDVVYRLDPSVELAAAIFPLLCDAVSELHESFDPPIIHRDLKPSNVMVSQHGVKIIDFGIARDFKDQASTDTVHFGTRAYAPPEQFGYGQTTVRSDVYALGMLLYFCLTEKTPDAQVVESGFNDIRIPLPLRGVLERACAFDPTNRFASARDVKTAFEDALADYRGSNPQQAPSVTLTVAQLTVTDPSGTMLASMNAAQRSINGIAADPAMPTPSRLPPPPPQQPSRISHTIGTVWNVAVVSAFALVAAACASLTITPPENMQDYPLWVDRIGYGFFFPAGFAIVCYALMDKRRLRERFPNTLGRIQGYHLILAGGVLLVALIIFLWVAAASK